MTFVLASFLFLPLLSFGTPGFADEVPQSPEQIRLGYTIRRNFPIETIWSKALLDLKLSDEKIVALRKTFRPYWHHRERILRSVLNNAERHEIRERIELLKQHFRDELDKHLATGQTIHITESVLPPADSPPPRESP